MRPAESFIEQPVRSLQIMLRVISEDDLQLPTVVPDGIYGPSTANAVAMFQRREGLPATGIVDQLTWDTIVTAYEPALIRVDRAESIDILMNPGQVYRFGDSSPYILLLQSMLIQLSLDTPTIQPPEHTGILDALTRDSLMDFQKITLLPVTGDLDKITWKHLVRQFTLNANIHERNMNISSQRN